MCARLKPITPRVIHQDKQTFVFCRKHIKDDEIGVTLREQGSKQSGDSISTVVVQIVHLYCRRDYVNKKQRNGVVFP